MCLLVHFNVFQLDIFQSLGLIIFCVTMTKILPGLVVLLTCMVLAKGTSQAHSMPGNGSETHGPSVQPPHNDTCTQYTANTPYCMPPYRCLGPNHPPGSSDPTEVTLEKAFENMLLRVHGKKKLLDNPECGEIDPDWCNISPSNSLKRYPIPCKYGRRNRFCSSSIFVMTLCMNTNMNLMYLRSVSCLLWMSGKGYCWKTPVTLPLLVWAKRSCLQCHHWLLCQQGWSTAWNLFVCTLKKCNFDKIS